MHSLLKILVILLFPLCLSAQNWEIGLEIGGTNYQGDLAPNINLFETKFASGITIKRNLSQFFAASIGLLQGEIAGDDKNYDHLALRNLDFTSPITEFSLQLEFNFFPFSLGLHPNNFTPYVFTGISGFKFNPQTQYDGSSIKLAGLDTEGRTIQNSRDKAYALFQTSIPLGGGFKFRMNESFNLICHFSFRQTFTDYLDDVSTIYYDEDILNDLNGELSSVLADRSEDEQFVVYPGKQRGRSDLNDWYLVYGITLSYRIKNSVCFDF